MIVMNSGLALGLVSSPTHVFVPLIEILVVSCVLTITCVITLSLITASFLENVYPAGTSSETV
jgi:hypothetical protein